MGNNARNNGCACRIGQGLGGRQMNEGRADSCPWKQQRVPYGGGCSGARPYGVRQERRENGGCGCNRSERGGCSCGCGGVDLSYGRREDTECGCNKGECRQWMRQLQEIDFSIQELVLYLDAYPDCCEALAHYRELIKKREELAEKYEAACGPLTNKGHGDGREWSWIKAPWPWHPEHPGNKAW